MTTEAKDRPAAQTLSRRSLERTQRAGESKKTVLVALAANAVIAFAKLAGGLMTGSAAMLAEAAHSTAHTTNQGFLLTSILLCRREPSPERPFGHGQERYLWTFLAATGEALDQSTELGEREGAVRPSFSRCRSARSSAAAAVTEPFLAWSERISSTSG